MRKIYKFFLGNGMKTQIDLPYNSRILTVQEQEGELVIWVLLDENTGLGKWTIYCFNTGPDIPAIVSELKYVATVQRKSGLVVHIFY